MSSAAPIREAPAGTRKYPPAFLAVFAVFLIATTICVAGTLIGVLSARPSHHDTLWFWASGHLMVHGHNPYDRQAVSQIESGLGMQVNTHDVPMTRNPPTALFLMALIGFAGPRVGLLLWSLLLVGCLVASVLAIRGMAESRGTPSVLYLAWCFAPALCCIEMGQTGLIILLGLALFLRFYEGAPLLAGAGLSLCTVKPHLLLPFGLVLVVWMAARRKWAIVLGAIVALAVEGLIAMCFDHAVWSHYRTAMRTESITTEVVPTFGTALRFMVDRTAMWLEFVPAAFASVWAIWYYRRNRDHWDWRTHGSLLTLVSLVAAPYSWFTDQVIVLPAIFLILLSAKKLAKGSLTLILAVMGAGAVEMVLVKSIYSKIYMWQGAAWLVWYLYATWGAAPAADVAVAG